MKWVASPYSEYDRYLFHQGTHYESYTFMGGHLVAENGVQGAPLQCGHHMLKGCQWWVISTTGMGAGILWRRCPSRGFGLCCAGTQGRDLYKYEILTKKATFCSKQTQYAFWAEKKPKTASRLWWISHSYKWDDQDWQQRMAKRNHFQEPMLIYEVHLGSWRRKNGQCLTYEELAEELIPMLWRWGTPIWNSCR